MNAAGEKKGLICWLRRNWLWASLFGLSLLPHLLAALQLEFAAMMAMYPAGMGPLSLLHVTFMHQVVGFLDPVGWLSAVLWAALWLTAIRWLWARGPRLTMLLYGLGWLLPTWLLYSYFVPPT